MLICRLDTNGAMKVNGYCTVTLATHPGALGGLVQEALGKFKVATIFEAVIAPSERLWTYV